MDCESKHVYGCSSAASGYFDVSRSLRGAKAWATRNGYARVFIRFNSGYNTALAAVKENGKWRLPSVFYGGEK